MILLNLISNLEEDVERRVDKLLAEFVILDLQVFQLYFFLAEGSAALLVKIVDLIQLSLEAFYLLLVGGDGVLLLHEDVELLQFCL